MPSSDLKFVEHCMNSGQCFLERYTNKYATMGHAFFTVFVIWAKRGSPSASHVPEYTFPFLLTNNEFQDQGSTVSIVTRLRARRLWYSTGRGREFFSSPPRQDRLCGLSSLLSSGYRGLFLHRLKRSGREAGHSPPSSTETKMRGALFPLLSMSSWRGASLSEGYAFMA